MLFISIPTPCHEKWNEMSPDEQGAFCNVCSKTVVDFTTLNDEEVQNYFLSNRGKKTCGRFRNDQLTNTDDPLLRLLSYPIPFWKKFLAIVLIVFGDFLSGCQNNTMGKAMNQETKTEVKNYTTTGITIVDMIMIQEADTENIQMDRQCSLRIDSAAETMGEFVPAIIENPIELGIIEALPVVDTPIKIILDENGCEKIVHVTKSIQEP